MEHLIKELLTKKSARKKNKLPIIALSQQASFDPWGGVGPAIK